MCYTDGEVLVCAGRIISENHITDEEKKRKIYACAIRCKDEPDVRIMLNELAKLYKNSDDSDLPDAPPLTMVTEKFGRLEVK